MKTVSFLKTLVAVVTATLLIGPAELKRVRGADVEWRGPSTNEAERPFHLGLKATAPWFPQARALSIRAAAGAAVLRVDVGGAAQAAGLRAGDLIVRLGNYDVENVEDLIAAAAAVPRGSSQPMVFVRGNQRRQTTFRIVDNSESAALAWYVHPEGAYRLRLPQAWRLQPPPEAINFTLLYDVLDSAERLYQVEFRRQGTLVESSTGALSAFVKQHVALHPDASMATIQLGGVPAAWVGWYDGGETRHAYYKIALVHGVTLYTIDITAPSSAGIDTWPLPVKQLLGTLQTSAAPSPGPPPSTIADVRVVRAGDIQMSLPTKWSDGSALRVGEAIWRVGDFADPEASLALLRNQPAGPLVARLQSPKSLEVIALGRAVTAQEGVVSGTTRPARMRIVVLPSATPTEDELVWVCYARAETWEQYTGVFDRILAGSIRVDEAVPFPSSESEPTSRKEPSP